MDVDASPGNDKSRTRNEVSDDLQRKARYEAELTGGCGYGKKKQKTLHFFWTIIWPALGKLGWKKKIGKGKEEGMVAFLPPSPILLKSGKKKKSYIRIKDVIDRILEKENEDDAKIADAFLSENQDYVGNKKERSETIASSRPRRAVTSDAATTNSSTTAASSSSTGRRPSVLKPLDLSWKDGGSIYSKQSSRIGDKYQATKIPSVGYQDSGNEVGSSQYCELIWDPKNPHAKSIADYIENEVPSNKREACLALFDKSSSNTLERVEQKAKDALPIDGSDWTEDERKKFAFEIFRLRKDIRQVSRIMKKDMKTCLAFYLGTYKKSDDYRLLKTIRVEEREEKASSSVHGVDACAICGDGGSLLICDGCEGEYHMSCMRPSLKAVPEGHWECDECVNKNFIESRETIIRNSGLYDWKPVHNRKRKAESLDSSSTNNDDDPDPAAENLVLRPTSPVLDAIRSFAIRLNKKLSV